MNRIALQAVLFFLIVFMVAGCNAPKSKKSESDKSDVASFSKDTYGYDKLFLEKHHTIVELKKGYAAVLLVPDFQGRVMTSTCEGDAGAGFGWINHDLIASG